MAVTSDYCTHSPDENVFCTVYQTYTRLVPVSPSIRYWSVGGVLTHF